MLFVNTHDNYYNYLFMQIANSVSSSNVINDISIVNNCFIENLSLYPMDFSLQDLSDLSINCADYIYESTNSLIWGGISLHKTITLNDTLSNWLDSLSLIVSSNLLTLGQGNLILLNTLLMSSNDFSPSNLNLPTLVVLGNLELLNIDCGFRPIEDSLMVLTKVLTKYSVVNTIDNLLVDFMSFMVLLVLIYLFLIFYFFNNNKLNVSETSADNDYISIWALSESEKELGSADDLLFLLIVITYIFGWFFGSYFYFIVSSLPEFMTFVYSLPGIFYVVFSIPTYLMYDYGLYYGTYLRGASISSFFIYEFGYDIIMICVFYIRLALQAIRLVLMFIACASYYDYIMFYNYKGSMFLSANMSLNESSGVFNIALYWFLIKVPGTLIYISYEVLHLWFILISQTMSFFAMIFWLFLYLYTFFIALSVENFFKELRLRRLGVKLGQ